MSGRNNNYAQNDLNVTLHLKNLTLSDKILKSVQEKAKNKKQK